MSCLLRVFLEIAGSVLFLVLLCYLAQAWVIWGGKVVAWTQVIAAQVPRYGRGLLTHLLWLLGVACFLAAVTGVALALYLTASWMSDLVGSASPYADTTERPLLIRLVSGRLGLELEAQLSEHRCVSDHMRQLVQSRQKVNVFALYENCYGPNWRRKLHFSMNH